MKNKVVYQTLLMFVAPDTTKGFADARGLVIHLTPCWCPRATLLWSPCQSEKLMLPPESMVKAKPRLLPRTMSGSMVVPQPGSLMISVAHDATKCQRLHGCVRSKLQHVAMLIAEGHAVPRDMMILAATQGHGVIRVQSTTESYVCVHGAISVRV